MHAFGILGGMSEQRLVAWGREMQAVHQRLREALQIARDSIEDGAEPESVARNLQLFCWGFCVALTGHHQSEDEALFPTIIERRPDLAPVIAKLMEDHHLISILVQQLESALKSGADPVTAVQHLDGIGAIMESHFGYEERQLLAVLDGFVEPDWDKVTIFGEIA